MNQHIVAINELRHVPFSGRRYLPKRLQLAPLLGAQVELIEIVEAVRTATPSKHYQRVSRLFQIQEIAPYMDNGVGIPSARSLGLDFVPDKQQVAARFVSAVAVKPEQTLEEGLKVPSLLLAREAPEHVHFILDKASTVSISFLRSLARQLGQRSSICLLRRQSSAL